MRLSIAVALLVAGVVVPAALRAEPYAQEQAIEHLAPPMEQRIEALNGGEVEQRVEVIAGSPEQTVGEHVPPSSSAKTASTAGKFVLGVASAGVALGVMAASLLLL